MINALYNMVGKTPAQNHGNPRHSIRTNNDHRTLEHGRSDDNPKRTSSGESASGGPSRLPRRSIRFQDNTANAIHHRRRSRKSIMRKPGESVESVLSSQEKMRDSVVSDFERQRRSTFAVSREDIIERMRYGTTRWYRFKRQVVKIMKGMLRYFRRLFSIPWSPEPISFRLNTDFKDDKRNSNVYEDFMKESDLEVMYNYDSITKDLFEIILRDRKDLLSAKDTYHVMKIDLADYPLWSQGNVDRLRYTFQVFDVTGDGLIDFGEFSTVLVEFGDNSSSEMREKHFNLVKATDSDSIDFVQFIRLVYNLTKDEDSMEDLSLAETFRTIDRNMGRIRGLDVVQQLQAGLF